MSSPNLIGRCLECSANKVAGFGSGNDDDEKILMYRWKSAGILERDGCAGVMIAAFVRAFRSRPGCAALRVPEANYRGKKLGFLRGRVLL